MSKIAVIGLSSSVEIFSILGAETFVVKSKFEAADLVDNLCKEKCGLILLTQSLFEQISETIQKNSLSCKSVITQIPG